MIGTNQETILFELERHPLITKSSLRKIIHLSKEQLNDSFSGLKKLGYVHSHVSDRRYRSALVHITPEGLDYLRTRFSYESG